MAEAAVHFPTLRMGDRGPWVRTLKLALVDLGFYWHNTVAGEANQMPNDEFDYICNVAVRDLQMTKNIPAKELGVCDEATWRFLEQHTRLQIPQEG
ncbi:MAG: hypothetical protein IMW91_01410 [Firmicutes bacterium]|nr:hypothetical protein [Bacillota bacterium]